eukprot:scaffold7076_cov153-Skeletonema_marinoi.AAC.4
MAEEVKVPLLLWMHNESNLIALHEHQSQPQQLRQKRELVLRKLTVAYAVAKLIHHAQQRSSDGGDSAFDETLFQLDKFMVRIVPTSIETQPHGSIFTTRIVGADLLSTPPLQLNIIAPDFEVLNSFGDYDEHNEQNGCSLEVEILDPTALPLTETGGGANDTTGSSRSNKDDDELLSCHLFGILLHELFAGSHPFPEDEEEGKGLIDKEGELQESTHSSSSEPLTKKTMEDLLASSGGDDNVIDSSIQSKALSRVICMSKEDTTAATNGSSSESKISEQLSRSKYIPLKDLGFPSSLSLLVENMLQSGWGQILRPDDSMTSLKDAIDDLYLLLNDPDRFLFDSVAEQGGSLNIRPGKLYGREKETALITDAFYRVSTSGESEILLVDGFSGCGKSKLIQSVIGQVNFAGGYVIQGKFDEIAQRCSQIGVLTNALNKLCILICEKNDPIVVNDIVIELMLVFGTHLYTLVRVLPNVAMLSQQLNLFDHDEALNLSNVPYILLLFLRVVSNKSRPVMLYLDDLQWADPVTLDVINCILSDIKGNNCVFVVGSYRNHEIECQNHPLSMFIYKLEECQVQPTKIHLNGLEAADLNTLISDALGLFPRMSRLLSNIIQRKTEGNPFYVLEFLKSLVERNLLQYSLRERRWVWDAEKIESEQISENVSELLTRKISSISEESQRALRIVSCFGTSICSDVVHALSEVAEYSFLGRELEYAYSDGFMERDSPSGGYKFAHDKVREAAYGQMKEEDRNMLHYDIGVALLNRAEGLESDNMLFLCVDQLNRGQAMISTPEEVLEAVEMNHSAASQALATCDFTAALKYAKTALKLVGEGNQFADYKSILFVMANAAYSCGLYEEASTAIDAILQQEASLDEKFKFDVYDLKITMLSYFAFDNPIIQLVSRQEGKSAYITCLGVLRKLGDDAASPFLHDANDADFQRRLEQVSGQLKEVTETDLMAMNDMTNPAHLRLIHFYNQAAVISYFVQPKIIKRITCRLIELTLEHGVSKYTAISLVRYAMTLPSKEAYRIGKMAISLGNRFDLIDQTPSIYLSFYGYIAIYAQPVQLRLMNENAQTTAMMYATLLNTTISTLISNDEKVESGQEREHISKNPEFQGSLNFNGAMKSFWLGHYERCRYHCEKGITSSDVKQIKSVMMIFYNGISCFHSGKKYKSNRMLKSTVRNAIKVMRERREESPWNYGNKLNLLEAESYSFNGGRDEMAIISYTAAIAASKSSKFVHEQGLSCELAALHFKRRKELNTAVVYFKQAKACYEEWGSQVKVDAIIQQIDSIQ